MKKSNNPLLYPLSWLYGLGVGLRNFLFNQGILKQQSYPIPLICVGNITVGGTGKTPHVELLISILRKQYRIAHQSWLQAKESWPEGGDSDLDS